MHRVAGTIVIALMLSTSAPGWAQSRGPVGDQVAAWYLVVPFENRTDEAGLTWLGEASAILLTDTLQQLGAPVISRDDRVRAFERLRIPQAPVLSYATTIRLSAVVGARRAVVGQVTREDAALVVEARVIDVASGQFRAEVRERGPLDDVFGLYRRVARRLLAVGDDQSGAVGGEEPVLPAAFELYVRGLLAPSPEMQVPLLSEALRLSPQTFPEPRIALWHAYSALEQHQLAVGVVGAVPAGHELRRIARFLGAVSMLPLARYEEAREIFLVLHAARPDAALVNNAGVAQLRRPDDAAADGPSAASLFAAAVREPGASAAVFFNLGYALWLEGRGAEAMEPLREAVRRGPGDAAAHAVLSAALREVGDTVEAAREAELARRLSTTYVLREARGEPVPRGLERVLYELDIVDSLRLDEAIVAAEQQQHDELAAFHLDRAERLLSEGREDEAVTDLRRSIYLRPYDGAAHVLLGEIFVRTGRFEEARDSFQVAVWSDDTPDARVALADAYMALGDLEAARDELEVVLARYPDHIAAQQRLERLNAP